MKKLLALFGIVSIASAAFSAPTANEDFVVAEAAAAYSNAVYTAGTNTAAATDALSASLTSRLSLVSLAATNYTDAASAALSAAIPTNNAQLVNGAGYVTAAITNGLQLTETDPTVPEWAKAESAPLPPDYVAVSNAAKSAATPQQLAAKQDKLPYPTNAIPQGVVSGLSAALNGKLDKTGGEISGDLSINGRLYAYDSNGAFDFGYGSLYMNIGEPEDGGILYLSRSNGELHLYHSGETSDPHGDLILPYGEGTLALTSDIPSISGKADKADVAAAALAATNYTDEAIGDISFPVRSVNQKTGAVTLAASDLGAYSATDGQALAGQVTTIGAHLNAEDARFVVTNYNSVTHTPEAYVEIKLPDDSWSLIWSEMTRWNYLYQEYLPTNYMTKAATIAALNEKADRAWGFYDSHSGSYAPDGYTWISSEKIAIAANLAYQRTITAEGAVWVLESNGTVTETSGLTNGFFRVSDDEGNPLFEIVKGDKRTIGADANSIDIISGFTPTKLQIGYSVVANAHPVLEICESLESPNWKAETEADCIANVSWSGESGAYVATVQGKQNYSSMFVKATYEVGGETYTKNSVPVEMQCIILNGVKYALGTATISGNTVLTLTAQ